jgi:hypothetical protein
VLTFQSIKENFIRAEVEFSERMIEVYSDIDKEEEVEYEQEPGQFEMSFQPKRPSYDYEEEKEPEAEDLDQLDGY